MNTSTVPFREGWPVPQAEDTYRGMRILRTASRVPGDRDWYTVYVVPGWPGIWNSLSAVRDYIDFRLRGRR